MATVKKAQKGFTSDGWWGKDNDPTTKNRRDSFSYWKKIYDDNLKNNAEVSKKSTAGRKSATAAEKSKLKPTLPALQGMRRNSNLTPKNKTGGKVAKAKDDKWIQKAVNPKHKGYCTPMTKATCTPKRKALAKTFKKMAKARK
jgi:hypothetical protein